MRVDELVQSLTRRPLALLLVVLVAVVGAAYGWTSASTTYESKAVVLIIPPSATDGGPGTNPLVNLDYNMSQLALTVSSQLQDDAVREAVVSAGGDGVYGADTLSSDNAAVAQLTPLVSLTASGDSADGAQRAVTALVGEASRQLAAIQTTAGVPATAQATTVVSAEPTTGAASGNAQLRAAGVLGLAAGFAALLALVAAQPLLQGGSRSRSNVPRSAVRALLQEEWERSGRNVSLSRAEQRRAWRNAEQRLEAAQSSGRQQIGASRQSRYPGRD